VSSALQSVLIALAVAGAPIGYVAYVSFLSPDNWVYEGGNTSNWVDAGAHAAPGPIAGAGLPALGIVAGFYWVVRRRRNSSAARMDKGEK
jgi:hypothetical protein